MSQLFVQLCMQSGLARPTPEYQFLGDRRFMFDYAWVDKRIALEVEGGIFIRGAHGSVGGILRDIEKYDLAAVTGWIVLRVVAEDLLKSRTFEMVRRAIQAHGRESETWKQIECPNPTEPQMEADLLLSPGRKPRRRKAVPSFGSAKRSS